MQVLGHTKESVPIHAAIAFENIQLEKLSEDEQETLRLALNLIQGVLEKKIFFQMSQELSIIDAVTKGYSMAFFMAILGREIESAMRNRYLLTLITIAISDFREITKNLGTDQVHDLIRIIQDLILKATRKSDFVVRWEMVSFAFLLTRTPLENARVAQERIGKYIIKNVSQYLSSSAELVIDVGIRQFDAEVDRTPEIFFAHAKPKEGLEKGHAEEPRTDKDHERSTTQE